MQTTNLGLGGVANPFLEANNPYLQDIINMTGGDLVKQWNTVAQPAYNSAMIKSGSFGNSGVAEMNRLGQQDLQKSLTDSASKLRFNDYAQRAGLFGQQQNFNEGQRRYEQDFDRAVFNDSFGQGQQTLQSSLGLLDWMSGRNGMDAANAGAIYDAPLSYAQRIGQIGTAAGGLGGSTTSAQGTSSNPLATALGGAQIGSSWWNRNNSQPISQGNQDAFESWGSNNGWFGTAAQ